MDVVPLSRRGTDLAGFSELYDIELATTEPRDLTTRDAGGHRLTIGLDTLTDAPMINLEVRFEHGHCVGGDVGPRICRM
jgi:hypothetical protein